MNKRSRSSQKRRRSAALLSLTLAVTLAPATSAFADPSTSADVTKARDGAMNYLQSKFASQQFHYVMDWGALDIYAAGQSVTDSKWSTADGKNGVTWKLSDLSKANSLTDTTTDFESDLLGILAAKQKPRAFGKKDYIQAIIGSQLPDGKFADSIYGTGETLLNSHIYAIIALYAAGVPIPNADKARDYLVSQQHADGSFNFSVGATQPDLDMTAAALIAMKALDMGQSDPAVTKALDYLKTSQAPGGDFNGLGVPYANSNTDAIGAEALLMWGRDPLSYYHKTFTLVDGMLAFQQSDGSFAYSKDISHGGDIKATQDVALALSDILAGKSVYQRLHEENAAQSASWSNAFPDLPSTHPYYKDNMLLVNLGVMAGNTDGTYGPDDRVTREQFAKIMVYGLSEQQDATGKQISKFSDVSATRWSNPFIAQASADGLIAGTSPSTFNPTGNITGGQLMAFLDRMLGLEKQAQAVPNQTSWQDGYVAVAKEQGLEFPNFDQNRNATRAEVGYSFARFYEALNKQSTNR